MLRRLLPLTLALVACGQTPPESRRCLAPVVAAAPPPAMSLSPVPLPPIVLVTIDGVRAQDAFDPTLTPNLHRLVERGVGLGAVGAPLIASGPRFVSLPGYREILTGRRNHDCIDNRCATLCEPTLLDELRLRNQLGREDVAVIASWEVIARAASATPEALTLSAGRSGGATRERLAVDETTRRHLERAASAAAWPGHGDYRPDAWTGTLALDYVAARHPRLLWVALGDTDEHAHRGDRAGYQRALGDADDFLGRLLALVGDDAIVLVASDHGRSANFRDHGDSVESSHTWLVAAGGPLPRLGLAPARAPRRLADIAPTLRSLLRLERDDSPLAGTPIPELTTAARATWLTSNAPEPSGQ